jgi:hypothetical protein
MRKRRIRRFLLWLLPARRVRIEAGPRTGPRALGGWSDLPCE